MTDEVQKASSLAEQMSAQAVPAGAVGVWWLGQASVVLKVAETIAYVDPYLAADERRLSPPPMTPRQVDNADLVLLTHDHSDHVDPETLPSLAAASPQARFVAPAPIVGRVAELVGDRERVVAARVGTPLQLGAIEIHPVAAKHEEFDEDPEFGFPHLGYVLRLGGVTVYHAGDTVPYDGLVETLTPFAIHLAFLPINGRDFFRTRRGVLGNMDYREAAEVAAAIGVETVIPVHYGMFAGNTVPPGHFVSYLAEHYPGVQTHVLGRSCLFLYHPPHSSETG